jgi:protein prenyltransferase alpha subunit repeat containing protein 1
VIDAQSELQLIDLMFTIPRHSKSAIAWHHRKWLREFVERNTGSSFNIESERKICERTATIYPRNYYSWVYRHNLLKLMASDKSSLNVEYNWSRAWVESHISDHTGIQHLERCLIVPELEFDIIEHWSWTGDNIKRYPGHEALWCHLRFCSYFAASRGKLIADKIVAFIHECIEESDRSSDEDNAILQKQLVLRYGLWVARLVSIC